MPFCKKCGKKLGDDASFCPKCGTPVEREETTIQEPSIQEPFNDNYQTQIRPGKVAYGIMNLENLPAGHIIDGRYEIKEKLGQGGFGAVYLAYDQVMGIDKALKIIPEAVSSDKEAMFDLQKEARTMIALNHANIVRVYDFHQSGSVKYIDMEYVDGKTLSEIKLEYPNKCVPEEIVKGYAIKIAEGMAYAHANNVLHKDIKPQNIKVNTKGEIKIMDFGIAETVRSSMSRLQNSSSSGTLVYMSPEQIRGRNVGKESDIYSFGAMLYELLSGHPPFYKGDVNFQILNEKPKVLSNVSDKINILILRCLEKKYKERFINFNEILNEYNVSVKDYQQSAASRVISTDKRGIKALINISLITKPEGANVIIDGEKRTGKSPLELEVTNGSHVIEVYKEGFKTLKEQIEVNESQKFLIELESLLCKLNVTSEEPGYLISINGELTKYKTPHTFDDIIPGKNYEIQINQPEYLSRIESVVLSNREEKSINLKSILGSIAIKTINPGQTILMNGKETEFITPHTFEFIVPGKEYSFRTITDSEVSKLHDIIINDCEDYTLEITGFSPKGFVFVEGGEFDMGSNNGEKYEKPVHKVKLSDYFIGEYPVTQELYEKVMGNNPSSFNNSGSDVPVELVSWYNAIKFCNKLSILEGLQKCYNIKDRGFLGLRKEVICDFKANGYRLPTEAEWEYAAKGGNKSKGYKYSGSNDLNDVGWYSDNSSGKTHSVGSKKSNELGIYDMSGNVWEWCWDWYGDYSGNSQTDPQGPSSGYNRVYRGGSWIINASYCRAAIRYSINPGDSNNDIGFRLARSSLR